MNVLAEITGTAADDESTEPRITIIYDDLSTGLRAKRFSDRLVTALGGKFASVPSCWRSELINLPEIAEEMARDAAASEFVILSLRGDTSLAVAGKQWLELWLAGAANGPSILIALFDPERSTAPHAEGDRCYLRHIAAGAGVAFFAHCTVVSNEGADASFPEDEMRVEMPNALWRSRTSIAAFFPAPLAA